MRIIFAGTPDFAVPTLQALIENGYEVVAVYTQPDRPAGRGRKMQISPVKQCAVTHGLPIAQPATLKNQADTLAGYQADVMVVVAYGLILPKDVLALPRLGCLNVHASLLPRWRGAAPIQRAIAAGDDDTGVTIMQMDAGLDTGDMLLRATTAISDEDTGGSLHDRLAILGAQALIDTLARIEAGDITPTPQDDSDAVYAHKLVKHEGNIDWQQPATTLAKQIRAFDPWPGSRCQWKGESLRVRRAYAKTADVVNATPGTVLMADENGIAVATASGQLVLTQIQLAGGKPLSVREFLNGHDLTVDDRLD